jgi:hypothetical protein
VAGAAERADLAAGALELDLQAGDLVPAIRGQAPPLLAIVGQRLQAILAGREPLLHLRVLFVRHRATAGLNCSREGQVAQCGV